MISKIKFFVSIITILVIVNACGDGPTLKDIPTEDQQIEKPTKEGDLRSTSLEDIHLVEVKEIIPSTKYVYLKVSEGNKEFWIATGIKDIQLGKKYVYKGALYKSNFESKELNRVFDEIYLVSNLLPDNHGAGTEKLKSTKNEKLAYPSKTKIDQSVKIEGSMKISDLVADPKKYEGQTIQLSGECIKINLNIMKMNWIHIQDGSQNDYDLVITTNQIVLADEFITIQAVVSLNKDFGAGYKYDLILENGVIIE